MGQPDPAAALAESELHPATREILQHFEYGHLPSELQEISQPFCDLAHELAQRVIPNGGAELTAALRKLLEAKDCAVRAMVARMRLRDPSRDASGEM